MITPEQMLDAINERFGRHPGYRALHAKGTWCKGRFTATPTAADLTHAAHMQGEAVEAIARVSNGSGDSGSRDYDPDVRGLAVGFQLPGGERTDILAQTAPRFPVDNADGFADLVQANVTGIARLWKFPVFLAKHPGALPSLGANLAALKPPPSYANRKYYAIHAYKWVDAGGGERYVRYTWVPEAGEADLSTGEAKSRGPDYLQQEIVERMKRDPVRFTLELQIAEDGDEVDDPTAAWPDERDRVDAGTLELTELAPDPEGGGELVVFDPMHLTDGIEPSGDPVLRYRPAAYSESAERRSA